MKLLFAIFVSSYALSQALCAAGPQTQPPAPRKAKAAQPLTIPEGAVLDPTGDYRFTDAKGRKWLYRKTPFGVSRREDTAAATPAANPSATPAANPSATPAANPSATPMAKPAKAGAAGMKATEDGDTVHFEKPGPFGVWKWDKKKSELDDAEKAALLQAQTDTKVVSKQD